MSDFTGGRNIAEYDWLIDYSIRPSRARLHAPTAEITRYYDDWWDGIENYGVEHGRAAALCGRVGDWSIPGVGSRMGLRRCARCCKLAGFPRGDGSPKNDEACRDVLGMPPSPRWCDACRDIHPADYECAAAENLVAVPVRAGVL